jgi:hypothetical protein
MLKLSFIPFTLFSLLALGQQQKNNVMEGRAREMHRIMGINDPSQWKKFIQENYTPAFLEKPMRMSVETNSDGRTPSEQPKAADPLEAKIEMLHQLHADFHNSEILSITADGNTVTMQLKNQQGLLGNFILRFEKSEPYRIDGLGIEVEN